MKQAIRWDSCCDVFHNQPIVTKQNGDVAIQAAILLHEERCFARGDKANHVSLQSSRVQTSRVVKLQRCGGANQQFC